MRVFLRETENQSARTHGDKAVKLVIAHTPEGPYEAMVRYITVPPNGHEWREEDRRVSYHTIINEAGTERTQLVPWSRKAWHAGAYNSLSDGIAAAGWASRFVINSPQARAFAQVIAQRLVARKLPARWSRDGGGEGFCRHADIQTDRRDPMNRAKWLVFVPMVKAEHFRLSRAVKKGDRTRGEVRAEDWRFGRWYLGLAEYAKVGARHKPSRPPGYPLRVPPAGWRAVRWYLRQEGT
jgi:N-acetyl-anhydromuramyl-L-alanine amidase AmpD